MINKKFKITAVDGLHARPATQLTQVASQFDADINMSLEDKTINLKSIMGVMSLAAGYDDFVSLFIEGSDEDQAEEAINLFLVKEKLAEEISGDSDD